MKTKKKSLIISILICVLLLSSFMRNESIAQIKFESAIWAAIKAKAKSENKLIFIDAYTSWCGPCKWLAKNVFTNDTVAEYYNATYINASFDMEKGEGIELAKQFKVRVYPSLLFIDANGEIVHRTAGAMDAAGFIQLGKDALLPEKQFATLEKKYKTGHFDAQFIQNYLDVLSSSGLETDEPLATYLNTKKEEDLIRPENWHIMYLYLNDYHSKQFTYLIKNTDAFVKIYTADSVNNKIFYVYSDACNSLIYAKEDKSKEYLRLKEEIKKTGFTRVEELLLSTDLGYYQKKGDYVNFAKTAVPFIDKYKSNDEGMLNNIAYEFYTNVKDKAMLAKAEQWAKKCYELNPQPEYSMDTYACALSVNGKKSEAVKLEKQAIELIKSDPQKYSQDAIPNMEKKIADWSK